MRQTKGNFELSKKYNPQEIGKRILVRMEELKIHLKQFEFLLRYCPLGFFNLNRYVSSSKMNTPFSEAKEMEDILVGLGKYFLDYAVNSYLIAFSLNTDVLFLATGSTQSNPDDFPVVCCYGHTEGFNLSLAWLSGNIQPVDIAHRIRESRKAQGLRIADMLEPLHVSLATYSTYENPDPNKPQRFSFPVFFELCTFLAVQPDEIMLGKPISEVYRLETNKPSRVIDPMKVITPETASYTEGLSKEMELVIELPSGFHIQKNPGTRSQEMNYFGKAATPNIPAEGRERVNYLIQQIKNDIQSSAVQNDIGQESIDELVSSYNWIMKNIEDFSPEDLQGIREFIVSGKHVSSIHEEDNPVQTEISLKQAWDNSRWLKQRLNDFTISAILSIYNIMSRLYPDLKGSITNRFPADM